MVNTRRHRSPAVEMRETRHANTDMCTVSVVQLFVSQQSKGMAKQEKALGKQRSKRKSAIPTCLGGKWARPLRVLCELRVSHSRYSY